MSLSREQIRTFMEKAAEKNGWRLTPDEELKEMLAEGFEVNAARYGYLQCPCRDSWGTREKDGDIICPCDYAAPDIREFGQCFCGLYLDQKTGTSGQTGSAGQTGAAGSIPERRPAERYP